MIKAEEITNPNREGEEEMILPERTANTMSDAIALSSPSGRMSKRTRRAAEKKLFQDLFGDGSCLKPIFPTEEKKTRLLRTANELRGLAERGMCTKKYTREAERMEKEAENIQPTRSGAGVNLCRIEN